MPGPVVVAGEALVDVVVPADGEPQEAPGGSPLNVAVGLARLGLPALLVTSIGDDARGQAVRAHVERSGVMLDEGTVVSGRTSTATAHLDASGAATYDFDLRWELEPRQLPPDARALHVGSLGTALLPGRTQVLDLVDQAATAGVLVSFDPNARPRLTPDAAQAWRDAAEVASRARLVKLSDEDLAFLRPGASAEEVAAELLGGVTDLLVLTAGAGGATAYTRRATVSLQALPSRVVDTVGAGDSFMAALLTVALEHGLDDLTEDRVRRYLAAAHEVAAVTVARRGADPPRRDELPPGWPQVTPLS